MTAPPKYADAPHRVSGRGVKRENKTEHAEDSDSRGAAQTTEAESKTADQLQGMRELTREQRIAFITERHPTKSAAEIESFVDAMTSMMETFHAVCVTDIHAALRIADAMDGCSFRFCGIEPLRRGDETP